ncbi:hypothetical protein [Chryseosolibacter indicus]|uniref:HMA domain-containing protein n=1 Tax=Chryseosolibacter indicus TaxID=2782351 RepID=A0ABS5VQ25_9BACT|nr:hypothetical protein [Chryseosolibacter indicus]MBT1703555.1 hypothetical protein [Chryseosolibacter indicus]
MYLEPVSEILIFKTNILDIQDIEKVASVLDADARVKKWNVDREDVDHVLRIQSDCLDCRHIIELVHKCGYECEELPD